MKKNKISENKNYFLYNDFHLGDNVFNMIFFHIIKKYIEDNNMKIYYYCNDCYLKQIREFIPTKNIYVSSIKFKPPFSIQLWINNNFFNYTHDKQKKPCNYNKYYISFFNNVIYKLNLNIKINNFFYNDHNLIERYELLDDKYKKIDILILNSLPLSNQYNYVKNDWDDYINSIKNLFKICTTTKINDILCTEDDNLTIKNIASISTNSKIIIAVNSGVLPGLLNEITLKNAKKIYIFDKNNYYSYPNFVNKTNINQITINELNTTINS